jgi:hypothetical protein
MKPNKDLDRVADLELLCVLLLSKEEEIDPVIKEQALRAFDRVVRQVSLRYHRPALKKVLDNDTQP